MKHSSPKWVLFASIIGSLVSLDLHATNTSLHHLDLDSTAEENIQLLFTQNPQKFSRDGTLRGDSLSPTIEMGKRAIEWLTYVNSKRPANQQLALSDPSLVVGYPIDAPKEYSRTTIEKASAMFESGLLPEVRAVLFEGGTYFENLPFSDEDFLKVIRRANSLYQDASRWLLLEPSLSYYESRIQSDIRGYYFLKKEADLQDKLTHFSALALTDQNRLRPWLVGQCMNSGGSNQACSSALQKQLSKTGEAWTFYRKYIGRSEQIYNEFFKISQTRRDVKWTKAQPHLMEVPFVDPKNPIIFSFIKDNIEDEFRFNQWRLQLNFTSNASPNTTHVVFEDGATPHVNALAGSEITMDANIPVNEYSPRWIIRHEYGHTLGLPDCYLEFFDRSQSLMVSYQLDLTNLMCSRKGHFLEAHFEELRKAYLR